MYKKIITALMNLLFLIACSRIAMADESLTPLNGYVKLSTMMVTEEAGPGAGDLYGWFLSALLSGNSDDTQEEILTDLNNIKTQIKNISQQVSDMQSELINTDIAIIQGSLQSEYLNIHLLWNKIKTATPPSCNQEQIEARKCSIISTAANIDKNSIKEALSEVLNPDSDFNITEAVGKIDNALITTNPENAATVGLITKISQYYADPKQNIVSATGISGDKEYFDALYNWYYAVNHFRFIATMLIVEARHYYIRDTLSGTDCKPSSYQKLSNAADIEDQCAQVKQAIFQYLYGDTNGIHVSNLKTPSWTPNGLYYQIQKLGQPLTSLTHETIATYMPSPIIKGTGTGYLWPSSSNGSGPNYYTKCWRCSNGMDESCGYMNWYQPSIDAPISTLGYTTNTPAQHDDWTLLFANYAKGTIADYLTSVANGVGLKINVSKPIVVPNNITQGSQALSYLLQYEEVYEKTFLTGWYIPQQGAQTKISYSSGMSGVNFAGNDCDALGTPVATKESSDKQASMYNISMSPNDEKIKNTNFVSWSIITDTDCPIGKEYASNDAGFLKPCTYDWVQEAYPTFPSLPIILNTLLANSQALISANTTITNPTKSQLADMYCNMEIVSQKSVLQSINGLYQLVLGSDGSLNIFKKEFSPQDGKGCFGGGFEWHAMTPRPESKQDTYEAVMNESDGNFVINNVTKNKATWASSTQNQGATRVTLGNDGGLRIFNAKDTCIWGANVTANECTVVDQPDS